MQPVNTIALRFFVISKIRLFRMGISLVGLGRLDDLRGGHLHLRHDEDVDENPLVLLVVPANLKQSFPLKTF